MSNHKWKDISENRVKVEKCIKCQIERVWIGSDMQMWQYIDYTMPIGSTRTTIRRPNCDPDRGKVLGFYRDGTFVKPDA